MVSSAVLPFLEGHKLRWFHHQCCLILRGTQAQMVFISAAFFRGTQAQMGFISAAFFRGTQAQMVFISAAFFRGAQAQMVFISDADPEIFLSNPDPGPRIHSPELRIRIREANQFWIRIPTWTFL
jgi:hypothetical protein